ncbi:hypothetical protein BBD46_17305 [Natrialba sp. SSL1]|nr:hypothetical protein BBD46_17305 [Natrialba sp. SSL1]
MGYGNQYEIHYAFPTSPQGSGEAIYRIFLVDGQTGDITVYEPPEDTSQVGSTNMANYVQQDTPQGVTTWDEFRALEPLPVFHEDDLFWMVRILPEEGTGINSYAIVNASDTNDVWYVDADNEDAITDFVEGEDEILDDEDLAEGGDDIEVVEGDVTTTLVIKDGDDVVAEHDLDEETQIEVEQTTVETNDTANE